MERPRERRFFGNLLEHPLGLLRRSGYAHVAAYFAQLDLSGFNPKAPPPKTPAFWTIVDAGRAPEDAELADVLDRLGNPSAVTIAKLVFESSGDEIREWLADRKNRRVIPHRLEQCGYVPIRNDAADDGLFKIAGKRQAAYGRKDLDIVDRIRAARELCR